MNTVLLSFGAQWFCQQKSLQSDQSLKNLKMLFISNSIQKGLRFNWKAWLSRDCKDSIFEKLRRHQICLENLTPENLYSLVATRNRYIYSVFQFNLQFDNHIRDEVDYYSTASKFFWSSAKKILQSSFLALLYLPLLETKACVNFERKNLIICKCFLYQYQARSPVFFPYQSIDSVP